MSRAFSTASRQFKKLGWLLNGTTQDTAWAQGYAESAINAVPQLADKVDTGTVQGNPHATLKTNDPFHTSIILQKGPIRITSAHVYPDGTVVFSKSAYGQVKLACSTRAPEGSGPE